MNPALSHLSALLAHNAPGETPRPPVTSATAARLIERTANVPFFAHSYPFLRNMDHGGYSITDYAEFAYINELAGICLHINDGAATALSKIDAKGLDAYRSLLERLGLALHLEISSTRKWEVDKVCELAGILGVENIRIYARHEGPLNEVIEKVYADMGYIAEKANALNLRFDYEQHEDLRADEIAAILTRLNDPRLATLFDYTNSWNAYEEPLAALRILAPWVRQVHIKGGLKTIEPNGWGQRGVPQGSPEDELPAALLLYELLMLGETTPQVICFSLENEVDYYAPAFRGPNEGPNPVIQYREPSDTPVPEGADLARILLNERLWAQQQVGYNRGIVTALRTLAGLIATP